MSEGRARPDRGELDRMVDYSVGAAASMEPAEIHALANRDGSGNHEERVRRRLCEMRVDRDARRALLAEESRSTSFPQIRRLDSFLLEPDDEPDFRVDRLWPSGGRVVLAAPYKAGKSTLVANLVRALADGESFLGAFEVRTVDRVVLVDAELGDRRLRKWFADQDILNQTRVSVVSIRGAQASFDLLTESGRETLASQLGPADVLIVDPLRPLLDAAGLDENHDAGRFLVALDEMLEIAGIPEAMIVHHMGHSGERSRGDSRLRDWPDAEWKIVRPQAVSSGADDPSAPRFFSAYGRDVEVHEGLLDYDLLMRKVTYAGGSRSETQMNALVDKVVAAVGERPGLGKGEVEKALGGKAELARKAMTTALGEELIQVRVEGTKHALYPLRADSRPSRPDPSGPEDDYSSSRP